MQNFAIYGNLVMGHPQSLLVMVVVSLLHLPEGGWPFLLLTTLFTHYTGHYSSFRDMLEERPLPAGLLVVALEIADQETERLFGIGQEDLAPGQAAVLV
ncbi:hypothetical protein [Ammonifex thiophilus]|uniref:Uncharacterized protein n=1 Tax=Ammonifex thiophilus TaxID=444093 RepID=A0A3D8P0X0_9THEO|nr:hypothetical protein [Ammonifex thiophilus]RDV80880.1 hypothetical protein DXX99_10365 [Ammonifex thiophilus]